LLGKAMSVADAAERSKLMERIEQIMQEQGVMVQPYWRSLYRHADPKVKDCPIHATFEHHQYKWWIAA
jgi:peptide/nickel transport system substrate-binding protein